MPPVYVILNRGHTLVNDVLFTTPCSYVIIECVCTVHMNVYMYSLYILHHWQHTEISVSIIIIIVSCGELESHDNVHYSSDGNSTLEGSTVMFWCTDHDALFGSNTSLSVCHKNGSWIPDPVSQCTSNRSGKLLIPSA